MVVHGTGALGVGFDGRGFYLGCCWRVVGDDGVLGSHAEFKEAELRAALVGLRVTSLEVQGPVHDLRLRFGEGVSVDAFASSKDLDHWHMAGGPDEMIVAGPGRLWSSF